MGLTISDADVPDGPPLEVLVFFCLWANVDWWREELCYCILLLCIRRSSIYRPKSCTWSFSLLFSTCCSMYFSFVLRNSVKTYAWLDARPSNAPDSPVAVNEAPFVGVFIAFELWDFAVFPKRVGVVDFPSFLIGDLDAPDLDWVYGNCLLANEFWLCFSCIFIFETICPTSVGVKTMFVKYCLTISWSCVLMNLFTAF